MCYITALALQYHHGDAGQGKVNYVDAINRYMPLLFVTMPGLIEKLAIQYNKLKGMDGSVALDQLICELEKCPEFGGRGYVVQVLLILSLLITNSKHLKKISRKNAFF